MRFTANGIGRIIAFVQVIMGVYTFTMPSGLVLTITAEVYFGDIIIADALLLAAAGVTLILIRVTLKKLLKALWMRFGQQKPPSLLALPPQP